MHILFSVLGAAGAFAYYWYVLRDAGDVVEKLADAAGKARGDYRRRQFRQKAEASTIHAIDDPRTAAIVMAVAVAGPTGELTDAQESVLNQAMTNVLNVRDPAAELIFAKWAVNNARDPMAIARQLRGLWAKSLTSAERVQLLEMIYHVAAAEDGISLEQARIIDRLRGWLAYRHRL